MFERRFYVESLEADWVPLPPEEAAHAQNSLRLRPGDRVTLFDGRGTTAGGLLEPDSAVRRGLRVRIDSRSAEPAPRPEVAIIAPGCKGSRLSWMIEKCTELGADRIVFADFDRSVVHVSDVQLPKLRRIAIETSKQCRRAWLPQLQTARSPLAALSAIRGAFSPEGVKAWLADLPAAAPESRGAESARGLAESDRMEAIVAIVGPEGGVSPSERDAIYVAAAKPLVLGPYVLRVETAAMAATAALSGVRRSVEPASRAFEE